MHSHAVIHIDADNLLAAEHHCNHEHGGFSLRLGSGYPINLYITASDADDLDAIAARFTTLANERRRTAEVAA